MTEARTRYDDEVRTLTALRRLIAVRQRELHEAEAILLGRVVRQDITLLNPISRKRHVNFMALMATTLQLDCKMVRRCVFHLRARERMLMDSIAEYEEDHGVREGLSSEVAGGTSAGQGGQGAA